MVNNVTPPGQIITTAALRRVTVKSEERIEHLPRKTATKHQPIVFLDPTLFYKNTDDVVTALSCSRSSNIVALTKCRPKTIHRSEHS